MSNHDNRFGYWAGRILAYLAITLITLLATGGGLALLKLLIEFLIS